MGLTLKEFKLIEHALISSGLMSRSWEVDTALELIKREIKLKEINPVTGKKYSEEKNAKKD